jgi:predicted DNA repair protein MutK
MYQLIFVPVIIFIIAFIPYLIFYILYIGELKHFFKISQSVNERDCEAATKTISKLSSEEIQNLAEIISKTHKCRFILSLIFILYLLF